MPSLSLIGKGRNMLKIGSPFRVLCMSVLDFLYPVYTQRNRVVFADRDVTNLVLWAKKGG